MYDVLIIGSGPAGLTAAVYASCFKLSSVVLGSFPGGQMALAPDIINYPGFVATSGRELTGRMVEQVEKLGTSILKANVVSLQKTDSGFVAKCDDDKTYEASVLILATGVERRKLNVKGEKEYTGKGVQYCASCEMFGYQGKTVAIIGGANAAAQAAIQISHAAKKVYMIYRGDVLRADPVWMETIHNNPVIEIFYQSEVKEILGDGVKLTGIAIAKKNKETGAVETTTVAIEELFIEIGGVPGTALLSPLGVAFDEKGFIAVDDTLQTSIPGIFAAGDVVSHKYSIEQISSAVGLGARAAVSAFSYFKKQTAPSLWGTSQISQLGPK